MFAALRGPPLSFGHFPRIAGAIFPPSRPGHPLLSLRSRVPFVSRKGRAGHRLAPTSRVSHVRGAPWAPFVLWTFPPQVGATRPFRRSGHPLLSLRSRVPFVSRKGRAGLRPVATSRVSRVRGAPWTLFVLRTFPPHSRGQPDRSAAVTLNLDSLSISPCEGVG